LPDTVRERRTKASWDAVLRASLHGPAREHVWEIVQRPMIEDLGHVRPGGLVGEWRRYVAGESRAIVWLWRALAAEHWLRRLSVGGTRTATTGVPFAA
jgi:hypothetical protein